MHRCNWVTWRRLICKWGAASRVTWSSYRLTLLAQCMCLSSAITGSHVDWHATGTLLPTNQWPFIYSAVIICRLDLMFIWHYLIIQSIYVIKLVADLGPEAGELWVVLLIEVIQSSHVLAVADQPVHWRKVFALSQLLVQTPEHLNYTESCRRHRVREVTTRRRHSTQHLIAHCTNQNAWQWTEWCLTIGWIKTEFLHFAVCAPKFIKFSASIHEWF